MQEITTVGLDLAKSVFQVHAVGGDGKVVLRRQLRRAQMLAFFSTLAPLSDRHGGLCRGAFLGAGIGQARPRGPPDAAVLRQALCQARQ